MKIYPGGVIPLFLSSGALTGQIAPQIRFFDVYYVDAPIVGFHIIGEVDE